MKTSRLNIPIQEVPEFPYQPEHSKGDLVFGEPYIRACIAWYKDIRLPLISNPYIKNKFGDLVNQDNTEIIRNVVSEREAVKNYLLLQPASYFEQIKKLAVSLPQMHDNCRIVVQIPTYKEERSIYHSLYCWATQYDLANDPLDTSIYEIDVINNGSKGYVIDNTLDEIQRFKSDFPNIKVNVIDVEFDISNVGKARKVITDIILQRSLSRSHQSSALYIESEDADICEVDKNALIKRIQILDEKPYLDAVSGKQDFSPHILVQNDYLLLSIKARQLSKELLRDFKLRPDRNDDFGFYNRVPTEGWSTSFTAEAYALIGGYLPVSLGEDYDIGRRISLVRGSTDKRGRFIPNTYTVEPIDTVIQSSPRRLIHAMANNISPWVDFEDDHITTEIRTLSDEQMVKTLPNATISMGNIAVFEGILTKQFRFFKRTVKDPKVQLMALNKLLISLGFSKQSTIDIDPRDDFVIVSDITMPDSEKYELDCHVDHDGNVKIDNLENVNNLLIRYKRKYSQK